MVDLGLHVRWSIDGAPLQADVGPLFGFTWYRRGEFEKWAQGFHAGGGVGLHLPTGGAWELRAGAEVTWIGFAPLPLPGAGADLDQSSYGWRPALHVTLSRRLGG